MRALALLLLLCLAAGQAWGATRYVCPGADQDGTDLNYGAEDGTSVADCFDGFAGISGLAAGDTLRIVNDDGTFYERYAIGASGTETSHIAVTGWNSAASTAARAIIEPTVKISNDQSFSAATTYATTGYPWTLVSGEVYKKDSSAIAHIIFEDGTLLRPILGYGSTEGQIAAALMRGQYTTLPGTPNVIYYRASDGGAPSTHMVRMNDHQNDTTGPGAIYCSAQDYIDYRYLTIRGVYVLSVGTQGSAGFSLSDCENITVDYVTSMYNLAGFGVDGGKNIAIGGNTVGSYNLGIGVALEATPVAVTGLVTIKGTYQYNSRFPQMATNAQTVGDIFDGDCIGVGQSGGNFTRIDVDGVNCTYNGAIDGSTKTGGSGVYVGSSAAMSAYVNIRRSFIGYNHGCGLHIGDEWTGGEIVANIITGNVRGQTTGTCLFAVWIDLRSTGGTYLGGKFVHNDVVGNYGSRAISFDNSVAGNTLTFKNNIFAFNNIGFGTPSKTGEVIISTVGNDNILEANNDIYVTSGTAFFRSSQYTCAQINSGTWAAVSANTGDNTVCVDPGFKGASAPLSAADFCLSPASTILSDGVQLGSEYIDYNGHAFAASPNMGALSACQGRPISAARPVSAARP